MRLTTVLGCLLVVAIGVGRAAGAAAPPERLVKDLDGHFTISVPTNWQVSQQSHALVVLKATAPDSSGMGLAPNVNVVEEPLPTAMSPAEYAAKAEVAMRTAFEQYAVVEQGGATVGGQPAYYRYFTHDQNGGGLYQVQLYLTNGRTGFVVTGTTVDSQDRIQRELPLLVQIINTFRLSP